MESKSCTKKTCRRLNPQPISEFRKDLRLKSGLRSHCKECDRQTSRIYASKHRQERQAYSKDYRNAHREELLLKQFTRYRKNLDKNRAKGRKQRKRYYDEHRETIIAKQSEYARERAKIDPAFRIANNLRRRLNHVIQDGYKSKPTLELLGCTPLELVQYLENQFTEEMNWENYGSFWHIDHIIPLAAFDLTKEEDQKIACRYDNLQPLTAIDNMKKGASVKSTRS